jgi:hypothetical protein
LRQFPMTSVWLGSTHRVDALMCTRSVGLHDAPNSKVLSHLHFHAISMHNEQVSWVDLNSVLRSRIGISHGSPNLTSASVYHSICQRCAVVTRAPRGLTFPVNVISLGTDSSGRESSAANLFGIRHSDRPSDRRVGTTVTMNPGDLPEGQDAPSAD